MPERSVVIAGSGAVTAVGRGIASLVSAIKQNASGLRASAKFGGSRFQSQVVGALPEGVCESESDDPAFALADHALREALVPAQALLSQIEPKRIALVLSTTKANIEALERIKSGRPCSDDARRHLEGDLFAADLAAEHGIAGPVRCVSAACVSGLIALQQGARMIQHGDADAVVVVGVDHLSAFVMAGFSALKALDPEGCRPFDRERRGLSPGEAGAAIVLARADLPGCGSISLSGWASTNDANHMTGPSRDGSGLASAIQLALSRARVRPEQIDYINAHGTGTPYNDAMESMALRTVFGANSPPVSGSKGMLGHTLGAAGIVETILCLIAMETGILPGTPRLNIPAEGTPIGLLREPAFGQTPRNVVKLNTGFGGINGALVLSRTN
jgi:3-oxoacyl-(acyl-carrier-protein) synthase